MKSKENEEIPKTSENFLLQKVNDLTNNNLKTNQDLMSIS